MDRSAVLFLLLSLALLPFSLQDDGTCPPEVCVPGQAIPGRLNDDWLAPDTSVKMKGQSYIFPDPHPTATILDLAVLGCYQDCETFNSDPWNDGAHAKYYTFIQTCPEGGTCNCYGSPACDPDDPDSPNYLNVDNDPSHEILAFRTGVLCQSSIKGDPHLAGGDNSRFDFSGIPNRTFCLISDAHLHINMYLGGWYADAKDPHALVQPSSPADLSAAEQEVKAYTWVRKVGVLWGHHALTFEARAGAEWRYGSGYMARMTMDGQPFSLAAAGDHVEYVNGEVQVVWTGAKEKNGDDEVDIYELRVNNVAHIRMVLRPEVASLRRPEDGLVHFTLDFPELKLSEGVHGVLGQTYRKDHLGKFTEQELVHSDLLGVDMVAGDNAEGFLDGTVTDYMTSGLLKADCGMTRFARSNVVDSETARAIEMSSAGSLSSSYVAVTRSMAQGTVGLAVSR